MTVGELIKQLEKMPGSKEVQSEAGDYLVKVIKVEQDSRDYVIIRTE